MREFILKTKQDLKLFDIFVCGYFVSQVIGFAGNYVICEYIEADQDDCNVELDYDAVDFFEETETF